MKIAVLCLTSLCVVICLLMQPVCVASAHETDGAMIVVSRTVQYLEDGSQLITTVMQTSPDRAMNSTVTGQKSQSHVTSSGDTNWTFTLHGTFTYGSGTATCTSAWYSHVINDTMWELQSATTSKSGNKAIAHAEMALKFLFITLDTVNVDLQLTCSNSGVLS